MKTMQINNNLSYEDLGTLIQMWDFDPYEIDENAIYERALEISENNYAVSEPNEVLIDDIKNKYELEEEYLNREREIVIEDFNEYHNFDEIYEICEKTGVRNLWIMEIKEFEKHLLVKCGAGNSSFTVTIEIGE